MAEFLEAFTTGFGVLERGDSDAFDRLSHRFSVGICLLFAFLLTGAQLVGDKIVCWTPSEFNYHWTKYAEEYCYMKNTYYVSPGEPIPGVESRQEQEISYYSWTPIILAFQAFLFLVPTFMWMGLTHHSGIHINSIVRQLKSVETEKDEDRKYTLDAVSLHMDRVFEYAQLNQNRHRLPIGVRRGFLLFLFYIFIKVCYIVGAIVQISMLNSIVGSGDAMFGISALTNITTEGESASRMFPRVTFCDFEIRSVGGNTHPYTMQCTLPWNFVNEKVYVFLWFWLVTVIVSSFVGLVIWLYTLRPGEDKKFIKKYLVLMGKVDDGGERHRLLLPKFCQEYLKRDGVFTIRMASKHVNALVVSELVGMLWDMFIEHRVAADPVQASLSPPASPRGASPSRRSSRGHSPGVRPTAREGTPLLPR